MDTSIKALEEALSIRRQIDKLEKRLSLILRGKAPATRRRRAGGRYFSTPTPVKFSAAARARWGRISRGKKGTRSRGGSGDTGPKVTE